MSIKINEKNKMDYFQLASLYAGKAVTLDQVMFVDHSDGNGVQIEFWNITDKPQPTIAELEALQPLLLEAEFKDNFIILSIGAYRKKPKGYSSAVESFNTLCNIALASNGIPASIAEKIIFYTVPDFSISEQCSEDWIISNQYSLNAMTLQEFMPLYLEFNTKWATENYKL